LARFYFLLWQKWALYVTLSSLGFAGIVAFGITLFLYMKEGSVALSQDVYQALWHIFLFWLPLVWSVTLLLALFLSLKRVFNQCLNGYTFKLLQCMKKENSETIEVVGYGDIKRVWRKWLLLLIWLVGAQMVLALVGVELFIKHTALFDWFSIYLLYVFVLVAGYFSFILVSSRCRLVRVKRC